MAENHGFYTNDDFLPNQNHSLETRPQPPVVDLVNEPQNPPNEIVVIEDPTELDLVTKDNSDTNEERAESPTTVAETYTFKCVFCEQILTANDDPKLLECLHNACGNCISNKMYENHELGSDKNQVECSVCNVLSEPSKIIENHFLLELSNNDDANKSSELKCSSCNDDANATSWCVDCSEFICDNCVQAHQRLKITKDHTIKPKEEGLGDLTATTSNSNLFCLTHPHEKLSLFCENCDKLTCRDCQLTEHREHRYKFTNEIAIETRKALADMLIDVGYKRKLLKSAMKVIDDRQTLIIDKKHTLVKEITQLVVKLTNTINVRGKQLVSKLTEVCDNKQKTLQEKKEALEQLSTMTDHCILFTQHALDSGSDMALLFSKKQMTEHLKRIKSRRADIPNPEIPVRIHLALDKFPELVKVMSTIGQIVVDGKVYPSQAVSPQATLPTSGSSPNRPPQQQSPHMHLPQSVSQYPQQQPPPYSKMPPSYGQYSGANRMPWYGPGPKNDAIGQPISLLAQQISRMQQLQRPLLPRMPQNPGLSGHSGHSQQQVSSSTHPQGMLQDRHNLRGLLQPNSNPVYVCTGPGQYQAVQPHLAQQYQQNRYHGGGNNQYRQPNQADQMRQMTMQSHRMLSQTLPQRPFNPMQSSGMLGGRGGSTSGGSTRWHVPQQLPNYRNMTIPTTVNDNFKITLKQPPPTQLPATVTSTIPKTPSPNQRSDVDRLDKYCADSVNDLIATIAKLDSNGVQVVAEGSRQKTGGSPLVDSSTGDGGGAGSGGVKIKTDPMDMGKDDPNEDWCAVCMDGGELVCCDKCPKVFHQYCHIPNLSVEENDTWQCLLCTNFADFPDNLQGENKRGDLTYRERKIAERLVLELYCQYDPSLPFREVIGAENVDYHSIIKNPIALDTIRQKINWDSPDHYTNLENLLRDIRLMFKNAYLYNPEESQIYSDAKTLEKFFDEQLEKFLPEYAYENFDDSDPLQPPNKKFKRNAND